MKSINTCAGPRLLQPYQASSKSTRDLVVKDDYLFPYIYDLTRLHSLPIPRQNMTKVKVAFVWRFQQIRVVIRKRSSPAKTKFNINSQLVCIQLRFKFLSTTAKRFDASQVHVETTLMFAIKWKANPLDHTSNAAFNEKVSDILLHLMQQSLI